MQLTIENTIEVELKQIEKDSQELVEILDKEMPLKDIKNARKKVNSFLKEVDEYRKSYTRDVDAFKKEIMNKFDSAVEDSKNLKAKYDEIIKNEKEKEKANNNRRTFKIKGEPSQISALLAFCDENGLEVVEIK